MLSSSTQQIRQMKFLPSWKLKSSRVDRHESMKRVNEQDNVGAVGILLRASWLVYPSPSFAQQLIFTSLCKGVPLDNWGCLKVFVLDSRAVLSWVSHWCKNTIDKLPFTRQDRLYEALYAPELPEGERRLDFIWTTSLLGFSHVLSYRPHPLWVSVESIPLVSQLIAQESSGSTSRESKLRYKIIPNSD